MNVVSVNENSVEMFSNVLIEAAEWLSRSGREMWSASNLSVDKLLDKYSLDNMRLCYDNDSLIGVYVLQWHDPLFWPELKENESGFLHKLAIKREYVGKGYGRQLIQSAEFECKGRNIECLRLNCGAFRLRLRNIYEVSGFEMVDRVFVGNRDQIRYLKRLI